MCICDILYLYEPPPVDVMIFKEIVMNTNTTVALLPVVALMGGVLLYVVGRAMKYAYSKAKNKKG